MYRFLNKWTRKLHRWGALATALPLLLVIASGLLLQVKKQLPWVQPATARGELDEQISLSEILASASSDPRANIRGWEDIDRLDIRPAKGIVKVRGVNRWEVQIDLKTRQVVQTEFRRSDLIESLHDGSFFGDWAKLSLFLGNGLVLLGLWASGAYLWYLPYLARRRKRKLPGKAAPAAGVEANELPG